MFKISHIAYNRITDLIKQILLKPIRLSAECYDKHSAISNCHIYTLFEFTFIVEQAVKYNVDTVVFEHLDTSGKKKGSKKQRLHFWKAQHVQKMVVDKVHRLGMRVSRICAWGTSKLAFDGTGTVKRGKASEKTAGNYSICEIQSGKIYHCDLNASYNIGSRYFIREILKSVPVTVQQDIGAKVPRCLKRSTCTLSDLISLAAVLAA